MHGRSGFFQLKANESGISRNVILYERITNSHTKGQILKVTLVICLAPKISISYGNQTSVKGEIYYRITDC